MASAKKSEFLDQDVVLADFARGLSHPARIAILRILAARTTCICGEIVDELPLSQSTVSQHLKALKKVGLIQGEIEGPKTCYCLDPMGVSKLNKVLPQFAAKINSGVGKKNKCC